MANHPVHRWVENGLAVLGGLVLAATAVAEAWQIYQGNVSGFHVPWANVLVGLALVVPKTIGRATAGQIWSIVAERFTKK